MTKLIKLSTLPKLFNGSKTKAQLNLDLVKSSFEKRTKGKLLPEVKLKHQQRALVIQSKGLQGTINVLPEAIDKIEIIIHEDKYVYTERNPWIGAVIFGGIASFISVQFFGTLDISAVIQAAILGAILNFKDKKLKKNVIENSIKIHYIDGAKKEVLVLNTQNEYLDKVRHFFYKYYSEKTVEINL